MSTARVVCLLAHSVLLIGIGSQMSGCSDDASAGTAFPASATATSAAARNTSPSVAELVLQGAPPTSVIANTLYYFRPQASAISAQLTFFISGKPDWAKFDSSTGSLSGMPAATNEGTTGHIVISARNDTRTTSLSPFVIKVNAPQNDTGTAIVTWTAPTENTDGSPISNLAGYQILYGTDPAQLTSIVTVNDATATSFSLIGLEPGSYYVSIVAFNASGANSAKSGVSDGTVET